jgi:hypothetical protein
MGRRPQGEHALTGAERQAHYRTRHSLPLPAPPPTHHHRPARPRSLSRVQRWHAAVSELVALQVEYAAWLQALPEATHDSPTGQALQAIVDLDLDEIAAVEPPRGFGRD